VLLGNIKSDSRMVRSITSSTTSSILVVVLVVVVGLDYYY
jgi:hypothetical protein